MKASVFIATSLDGFIARSNGEIDWLERPEFGDEDHGYQAFMDSVDCLVMGRNSYEKVLSFGIDWPYKKPVVVLTRRPLEQPKGLTSTVEAMQGTPNEVASRLEERGVRHVYVDGGATVQQFLRAGLVQQIIMTTIPVLLGEGISLFGSLERDIRLRHVATQTFAGGLVQTEYTIE